MYLLYMNYIKLLERLFTSQCVLFAFLKASMKIIEKFS